MRHFREQGVLIARNLLAVEELATLRRETLELVNRAARGRPDDPDYLSKRHELTGERVPYRVEYVIDKSTACRALLGHPFVLRSVERIQGAGFVPTWDSMVFKNEGAGAAIPWHRDQELDYVPDPPVFNVDFYLDGSDLTNCLWAIPGSNRWSNGEAAAAVERLGVGGFRTDGAVPIVMRPGDVLFHDILVVHGSPEARSGLRRVLYYEFRAAEVELRHGPHVPEYAALKQRVLLACLRTRAAAPYARGERPYACPPTVEPLAAGEEIGTYRYPHERYWRGPIST